MSMEKNGKEIKVPQQHQKEGFAVEQHHSSDTYRPNGASTLMTTTPPTNKTNAGITQMDINPHTILGFSNFNVRAKKMSPRSLPYAERLTRALDFDLLAPGLMTLLGFDGIELWGLDTETADLLLLRDFVKSELLLEWSRKSMTVTCRPGKKIIGRVFGSGKAEWKLDLSVGFARKDMAHRLGVKTACCIRCQAHTGEYVVIFMYSCMDWHQLGLDSNKTCYVEEMINKWVTNRNQAHSHNINCDTTMPKIGSGSCTSADDSSTNLSGLTLNEDRTDMNITTSGLGRSLMQYQMQSEFESKSENNICINDKKKGASSSPGHESIKR